MRIYLLRHGDAEDHASSGRDFDRRLTSEGIERMRAEAEGMRRLELSFDQILTSPLLRARETAEIVAETLQLPPPVLENRVASAAFRLGTLQTILQEQPKNGKLLFVGHQPDMSEIIHAVTGGLADVKRGGFAGIELHRFGPPAGILLFLMTPRQLISLANAPVHPPR